MLVNKTLETPEGTVVFEGELSPTEVDFVVKVGLNYLLQMGALPLTKSAQEGIVEEGNNPLQ